MSFKQRLIVMAAVTSIISPAGAYDCNRVQEAVERRTVEYSKQVSAPTTEGQIYQAQSRVKEIGCMDQINSLFAEVSFFTGYANPSVVDQMLERYAERMADRLCDKVEEAGNRARDYMRDKLDTPYGTIRVDGVNR